MSKANDIKKLGLERHPYKGGENMKDLKELLKIFLLILIIILCILLIK